MDTVLRGGLAGMIGYTVCGVSNYTLYMLGVLPSTGIHYNAILLTPPNTPVNSFTLLIGVIAGILVTGPFVGVIISYLIEWSGRDYAWIKGFGVATVLWPVHVAILPSIATPNLYPVLPPIMVFACYFFEGIFGIVTALAITALEKHRTSGYADGK